MFGDKCSRCGKKVSKKYEFCPQCGLNLSGKSSEDLGFLGKNDLDAIKIPFGVKAMLKPLMKEFNRQMLDLEKEMKKQQPDEKNDSKENKIVKSFSVRIGAPGQKPMKISTGNVPTAQVVRNRDDIVELPKIDDRRLEKVKNLPRKEPETNVRRLSDNILYEISLPGVKGLNDINVAILEDGIEVKAIAKKEVFVKSIDVSLPLKDYDFQSETLILELESK